MTEKRFLLLLLVLVLGVLLSGYAAGGPDMQTQSDIHRQSEEDGDDNEESEEPADEPDEPAVDEEGEEILDVADEESAEKEKVPEQVEPETEVIEKKLTPAEIRNLEDRFNVLQDQIFKSRAKLKQLHDQLAVSSVSVINAKIFHTQDHSGAFKLLSLKYTLDGFELYEDVNTDGHLTKAESLQIFEGSLLPGDHLLVVDLFYRGRGFGLFTYLNNYTFHVKSRYSLVVEEGQAFDLDVTAYDKGEFLAPLKDRLRVKFVRESRNE